MIDTLEHLEDENYRYGLHRNVKLAKGAHDKGVVLFVMLNPSTARAIERTNADNDYTIRKCKEFAKRWGYGQLRVVNLIERRGKRPSELAALGIGELVGPNSDERVRVTVRQAALVVCAWGDPVDAIPAGKKRAEQMLGLIREEGGQPHVIGCLTNKQNPRHPSRAAYAKQLRPWNGETDRE